MSGSIKDYTKYYKFYIPRFDLATWHDYIENNFRSIDALLNDIFSIANYKGEWKNSTSYTVDDVVFIGNDGTQYEGKLCKVLVNHTTPGSGTFANYYANNQNKYLVGLSASDAQTYAQNAQTSANLAKNWACKQSTTVDGTYYSAQYYANEARNRYLEAKAARDTALTYMSNAGNSATNASNFKNLAQDWATKIDGIVQNTDYSSKYYAQQAASSATNAYNYAQSVNPNNLVHKDGSETITGVKIFNVSQTLNGNTLKCINVKRGTKPTSIQYANIYMTDSTGVSGDNTALGCFRTYIDSTGNITSTIRAFKNNIAGTNQYADIYVCYPASGNPYTYAPAPTDTTTTSGTQIATTGWVNSVGNNVVHLSGNETVSGNKTFTGFTTFNENPYITREATRLYLRSTDITKGTAPSTPVWNGLVIQDNTGNNLGYIRHGYTTNKNSYIELVAQKANALSDSASASIAVYYPASGSSYAETSVYFRPSSDNSLNLGDSSHRWKQLYAGTSTISTSDERKKQQIEEISEQVLLAWGEVNFYQFKYNDSVAEKGENARLHTGLIAQRIKTIFESHNLDATKYGLLCYDEWEAQEEEKDEEGNIITPAREAGNLYSLRYEECLCMEAAYQRYRANKLEQRLQNIENLLNINNQGEN